MGKDDICSYRRDFNDYAYFEPDILQCDSCNEQLSKCGNNDDITCIYKDGIICNRGYYGKGQKHV